MAKQVEALLPLHPQLELELALEDADEDRGAEAEAVGGEPAGKVGEVGRAGERRAGRCLRQAAVALGVDGDASQSMSQWRAARMAPAAAANTARPSQNLRRTSARQARWGLRTRAHRLGARPMLGTGAGADWPMVPVDIRPERCVPSS